MNILVISSNYPSSRTPHHGTFVYNLMQELAKSNEVTVISPYKIHRLLSNKKTKYGEENCKVLRPLQFSFSDKRYLCLDSFKLTLFFFQVSIRKALSKLSKKPDIIYCHFLINCLPILDYAENNNIPIVVASGEAEYSGNAWENINKTLKDRAKKLIKHIICVSQKNKDSLIKLGFVSDKLTVIPNAVNQDLFKPLDKELCKNKLGISKNEFIVGFVGYFIDRKGPNRLIKAIEKLNDSDIKLICIGTGGELIENNFTKVLSFIPNSQLPEIFNTFDVFVLPTLHEGHCNAIEEAKACGIPVISSLGTSVEEQLNSDIGILVDPLDIDAIAESIFLLKQNKVLHTKMIDNLLKNNYVYCLAERSDKIVNILNRYV